MKLVGAIHSIVITQRRGRFLKRNLVFLRIDQGSANIPLKHATVYTLMNTAAATNPLDPQATINNRFSHGNWHYTEHCLCSTKTVRMGENKQKEPGSASQYLCRYNLTTGISGLKIGCLRRTPVTFQSIEH